MPANNPNYLNASVNIQRHRRLELMQTIPRNVLVDGDRVTRKLYKKGKRKQAEK